MVQSFDLILRGGTVVNHDGRAEADVGMRAGRIAAIGDLSASDAGETLDVTGLHVLPGVIDSQVHFREPGNEHKEDLETGSRAAVMGGVTAVFEMPNTSPSTTTPEALNDKITRATGRMFCDFAFYAGASTENAEILGEMERMTGCAGVKIFMGSSTGNLLVASDDDVRKVLSNGSRRVAVHCEDEDRLVERKHLADEGGVAQHPVWRDAESAIKCTRRLLALARETGRRIHVLHVTTAEEMDILAANRDIASVEATPQHLTLAAPECYERLGTYAQMNPPIRDARHRDGLWAGLKAGVVDVIGSDHSPHTAEEKARAYPASPAGMPGVQTLLPLMLDHMNAGKLSLERLVDLTSHGAARIFGLAAKGRLAVGYDADLTVIDLKATREITEDWNQSRCGWTAFAGQTVTGWPVGTIIRGRRVMWEDEIIGAAHGQPIRFQEAL